MTDFTVLFYSFLVLCGGITFRSSDYYKKRISARNRNDEDREGLSKEVVTAHNSLLKKYLFVYLLAVASDWLQGPYVYALYSDYGFTQHEIAQLFVAGFGSSMIFGSFVGSVADKGGRRLFVIIFAVVYLASCMTKHFKNYNVLMLGRLLGGVATSLLFSVFEAWLIKAHADAELPKQCLPKSFSWAAFGNSGIAIAAGLVANKMAHVSPMEPVTELIYKGGFLAPFDLAAVALVFCAIGALGWEENYGDSDDNNGDHAKGKSVWHSALKDALTTTIRNRDITLCGVISSFFEGSMYIFVFMWTPLLKSFLKEDDDELPFGMIFATFMVCCMTGSSLFSILVEKFSVEKIGIVVFGVAGIGMAIVALEINGTISYLGMNLFEMCVGLYFPIMGTMKGGIVPENKRVAIYNLYRIPLNLIVLFSLLTDLTPRFSFALNATMLSVATILQVVLTKRRVESSGIQESGPQFSEENIIKPLVETECTQTV